jgi:hypothetical protein
MADLTGLRSTPILISGSLLLMAQHLSRSIEPESADPSRLRETADSMDALLDDAEKLSGYDHRVTILRPQVDYFRAMADAKDASRRASRA